ncbi:MAG: hypothetical protein P4L51_06105 [Puia sp.]|nr:hypothetical protein [Puia sp.]
MESNNELTLFMEKVKTDARIGPLHISIFMAILYRWRAEGYSNPLTVSAKLLMPLAKISGPQHFYRCMKQLHEFGYIRYEPSNNPAKPSQVFILKE